MGSLFLIRHGQASYGELDYDRLSARGQEQAKALGPWLARARLDTIYVGPLRRQQQTIQVAITSAKSGESTAELRSDRAAEVAGVTLPVPVTLPELAEYPAFEMLQHLMPKLVAEDPKFAELATAPTPRLLDEAFHTILGRWSRDEWFVEGVERVSVFVARVRTALDQVIRAAGSGARIACVTSAGPIGVAVGLAFGIPDERMVRTSVVIRNASITQLEFRSKDFDWQPDQLSLVTFNHTSHLPEELDTHR